MKTEVGQFECRRLKATDKINVLKSVQECLQLVDPDVCIGTDGVGESDGSRLLVRWAAQQQGKYFSAEVLDREDKSLFEVSVCPSANERQNLVIRRVWQCQEDESVLRRIEGICCLEMLWETVFADCVESESVTPKNNPHFLGLVAAGISSVGVISIRDNAGEISALKGDVEYWQNLARAQSKLLKQAQRQVAWRPEFALADGDEPDDTDTVPARDWQLGDLEEWAALNNDRIAIMPRAIAAAKRSNYESPAMMYECLELLANEYRKVKLNELDRHAFKDKASGMGLLFGGSVEPTNAGRLGEEYFIRWGGRRIFLDQHLCKGNARDTRYCLRIYYTWDENLGIPVVGWLPSHLGTKNS